MINFKTPEMLGPTPMLNMERKSKNRVGNRGDWSRLLNAKLTNDNGNVGVVKRSPGCRVGQQARHPRFRRSGSQSSQMVSRSMSPRRSAPQTLHLLRLSRDPKPSVRPRGVRSRLLRDLPSPESELSAAPSSASASAFRRAILSASRAASSASGESGIVSRLEMLGLLDRAEVGVEDSDDDVKDEREP